MSEAPERLSTRVEYAEGFRELKEETFSEARLAEGWRAIEASLGEVSTAPSGSDLAATATETGTLLKLTSALVLAGALIWAATHEDMSQEPGESSKRPKVELKQELDLSAAPSTSSSALTVSAPVVEEAIPNQGGLNDPERVKPDLPRGVFKGPPPGQGAEEAKPSPEASVDVEAEPSGTTREAALGDDLAHYRRAEALVKQGLRQVCMEAFGK